MWTVGEVYFVERHCDAGPAEWRFTGKLTPATSAIFTCFFLCISRVRANNSNWEGRKPTRLHTVVMFSLNSVGRSATGRAPLTAATSLVQSLPLATKTHRLAACHPAAPCLPARARRDSGQPTQVPANQGPPPTIVSLVLLLLVPRVP